MTKTKADWLRSEIEKLEDEKFVWLTPEEMKQHDGCRYKRNGLYVGQVAGNNFNQALTSIITRYKEELKVLESK